MANQKQSGFCQFLFSHVRTSGKRFLVTSRLRIRTRWEGGERSSKLTSHQGAPAHHCTALTQNVEINSVLGSLPTHFSCSNAFRWSRRHQTPLPKRQWRIIAIYTSLIQLHSQIWLSSWLDASSQLSRPLGTSTRSARVKPKLWWLIVTAG